MHIKESKQRDEEEQVYICRTITITNFFAVLDQRVLVLVTNGGQLRITVSSLVSNKD